jgi:hypothetical protein
MCTPEELKVRAVIRKKFLSADVPTFLRSRCHRGYSWRQNSRFSIDECVFVSRVQFLRASLSIVCQI